MPQIRRELAGVQKPVAPTLGWAPKGCGTYLGSDLANALSEVVTGKLIGRSIGNALRTIRGRTLAGLRLEYTSRQSDGMRWQVTRMD